MTLDFSDTLLGYLNSCPIRTDKLAVLLYDNDQVTIGQRMCLCEGAIDIGQQLRQHEMEERAVGDQEEIA